MTDVTATPGTTADYLRYWGSERGEQAALRFDGGQLTYAQMDARTSQLAQALRSAGVEAGERVAYLDKNSPGQLEIFFAAAKLGAVPCPVNYRLAPPEIAYIVGDAGARVLAVGEEFVPVVRKVAADLGDVKIVVIRRPDGGRPDGGRPGGDWPGGDWPDGDWPDGVWDDLDTWRSGFDPVDPGVRPGWGDVAFQLYSSGTTGRPKGVLLTQANLAAGMDLYPDIMGFGPESVSLVPMPLYHIGGGGWALEGFAQGATNVLVREIVPDRLVDTIVAEKVTHGFLVPAVLQFMLSVPGVEERDFSALRCLLYGASPISEKVLAAAVRTFGCDFVQAYGLTESTGTIIYLPAGDHDPDGPGRHRLRAVGVPIPGSSAKIVDPASGEEKGEHEVGEIWVQGPTVMAGYWHLPDETEAALCADGWLRTGDAGYRDADGYFYVHDRVKDMIVSGGENIYPAEVENAIMSHPGVADVAVIGIPHDKWGETPLAMVVRRPGTELDDISLLAYCRERLAGFKCPTAVEWLAELPRNPSGKVLKKDLRAPYWAGRTRLVG